jgi:phosphatidylserine/phosphatidylglycerophosphate/cardiolipin synthase-like enzyme
MRFKNTQGQYKLYAVTGTHTIAFAIDCEENDMKDLLGFMVEKEYHYKGEHVRVTVMGFKVFKERVENPVPGSFYSTYDNPIQSFTWEDFTAYPAHKYIYHFTPLYNKPLNIIRGATFSVEVETEPAWKKGDHSIFFNRGVASSQAYALKFGNISPDKVEGNKAYNWLSRGLKEAMESFIGEAKKGDALYGCFYEFTNDEILHCLREAAERDVKLHIIYDAKDNSHIDSATGKIVPAFPKTDNEEAIKNVGLDKLTNIELIPRQRNKSYISHNKFMVLVFKKGSSRVWTGSTNISTGGIFGQANVGHCIDDTNIASKYLDYWNALKADPDSKTIKAKNEKTQQDISLDNIPEGVTCFFSPRTNLDMLNFYAKLLDSAKHCACITLAFGINQVFIDALSDNSSKSALTFLLLEKDAANLFDYVYTNNVIKAVGAYITANSLYKWVRETNTFGLRLNTNVMYIHTKFLLKDPLSKDPIVVTGSANFSEPSTDTNDENMIVIKGNTRVADIYFTEFLRFFNHYYFRWIVRKMSEAGTLDFDNPAFLRPGDKWTEQYKKGKYKRKKVEIFSKMHIPSSSL